MFKKQKIEKLQTYYIQVNDTFKGVSFYTINGSVNNIVYEMSIGNLPIGTFTAKKSFTLFSDFFGDTDVFNTYLKTSIKLVGILKIEIKTHMDCCTKITSVKLRT